MTNSFFERPLFLILLTGIFFSLLPACTDAGTPEETIQENAYLEIKASKEQIYLTENIPVTIKLYFRGYSLRDIQYPQLTHRDLSIQEFEPPVRKKETLKGMEFETLEFKTTLFGKKPGKFKLGPARLQCTLLVQEGEGKGPDSRGSRADRYFGTPETRPLDLLSNEISLAVLSLPEKGKPAGFGGAVGNFRLRVEVHPKEVKVGEPITLKVMVEGEGNFNTLGPPEIEAGAGFKTHEPRGEQRQGIRIYEQVLIPVSDTLTEIPAIRFSFFDPEKRSYRTVRKGPIPIKVKQGEGREELKSVKNLGPTVISRGKESMERDIVSVKKSYGTLKKRGKLLYQDRLYRFSHLLPLFLLLALWVWNRRKERIRTDLRYARLLRAGKLAQKGLRKTERNLREGKAAEFYDSVFKTLQGYLGNRFDLPAWSLTANEMDHLPDAELTDERILEKIRDIFSRCDRARYAPYEFSKPETEETFQRMKEIINHLEGSKWGRATGRSPKATSEEGVKEQATG